MADTKRQNAGGKPPVATPNIGPSGMVSLESALSGAIGARIRITTTIPTNNTLEGTLFTACPITNLIAINTASPTPTSPTSASAPQPGTYHILPIPKIASFTLLSLAPPPSSPTTTTNNTTTTPDFTTATPALTPIDLRALSARAQTAITRLKTLDSRRGRGVGREGQEIFDALGRTLPTRWSEQSIVVLDAVVIKPPYRIEDCVAGQGQGQQGALGRVRKVLEMERKRLADRSNRPAVPAPAAAAAPATGTGSRKGG
ncbi:hypothetical protein MMC16_002477 [Acarospora aff. strigata]|nr:hypothetical protein [Acarospora aff. strigata]